MFCSVARAETSTERKTLTVYRFSAGALQLLPERGEGSRAKAKRADRIPDQDQYVYILF